MPVLAGEAGVSKGPEPKIPLSVDRHTLHGFRKFKALMVAIPPLVLAACGVGGVPTPGATSIRTEPSTATTPGAMPSSSMEVATPTPSEAPTASATIKPEATPFVLPSIDSIINPSEKPQTPITLQQVKADVDKLIAVPNSGLTPNEIKQLNDTLAAITNPATPPDQLILDEAGLVAVEYSDAKTLTNIDAQKAAYQGAFDSYWYAAQTPSNIPTLNSFLQTVGK